MPCYRNPHYHCYPTGLLPYYHYYPLSSYHITHWALTTLSLLPHWALTTLSLLPHWALTTLSLLPLSSYHTIIITHWALTTLSLLPTELLPHYHYYPLISHHIITVAPLSSYHTVVIIHGALTISSLLPTELLPVLTGRQCTQRPAWCTQALWCWRVQLSPSHWQTFLDVKLTKQLQPGMNKLCTVITCFISCLVDWMLFTCLVTSKPVYISELKTKCRGGGDSSVVRAPDSWLKGRGFESLLERRENFLLQGRLSVLTLISVSVPPPCYHSST